MNYANHIGYSDVSPFEIVRRISEKTLEVREMDSIRSNPDDQLGFVAGGFFGHCSNQHDQKWTITPNNTRTTIRIRLGKRGWKDKGGARFKLADKPIKFHDYNF